MTALTKTQRSEARTQIRALTKAIDDADGFAEGSLLNQFGHLFGRDMNVLGSCDQVIAEARDAGASGLEWVTDHLREIDEAGGWTAWVEAHPDETDTNDERPF